MAKQSLASAYVQIIPSADGISGSLAEALGGGRRPPQAKSSGASLGASLVSSLKGFFGSGGHRCDAEKRAFYRRHRV